jgi:hypothetical protein
MWYLLIATIAVPVQAAAAVIGAACAAGPGAAMVTAAAVLGLQMWIVMYESNTEDALGILTAVTTTCILVHVVVTVAVAPFLKALALVSVLTGGAFFVCGIFSSRQRRAYYDKTATRFGTVTLCAMAGISVHIVVGPGFLFWTVFAACIATARTLWYSEFVSLENLVYITVGVTACILVYAVISAGFLKALTLTVFLWTVVDRTKVHVGYIMCNLCTELCHYPSRVSARNHLEKRLIFASHLLHVSSFCLSS